MVPRIIAEAPLDMLAGVARNVRALLGRLQLVASVPGPTLDTIAVSLTPTFWALMGSTPGDQGVLPGIVNGTLLQELPQLTK